MTIAKSCLEARRLLYTKGKRVELVRMDDPYTTLKPGDRGTVSHVDDIGTVFVDWDCGSRLGAAHGEDEIRLLTCVVDNPSPMTEAVIGQILAVRATAKTNMFDLNAVQRIASDSGYHDLVNFIETEKGKYARFIMAGEVT